MAQVTPLPSHSNITSEYFPKPKISRGNESVELDLYNYVTKPDLKNTTGVDTSKYSKKKKKDLANFKSDVHELDIDKSKSISVDLSKLS